jgi:hypothetical protein
MVKFGGKSEMRKVILFAIIIFLISLFAFSTEKEAQPKYTIHEGHPRLYMTKERLEDIRKRCADKRSSQAKYYAILKDFADHFTPGKSEASDYSCISLAFLYAVGKVPGYDYSIRSIDEYGRLGVSVLTQLHPAGGDLGYYQSSTPNLIACYDWLFLAMTPEQRATVFKNFTAVADKMRASGGTLGQYRGTHEMYAYYGLAFYADGRYIYPNDSIAAAAVDKKAKDYCDFFASWHRDQNLAILEVACKGGAYPSGTMYGEDPYPEKLWRLDAWDTASTDDLYKNTTCLTGYPLWWLYQMLPYRTQVRYDCANGWSDRSGGIVRFGDYRYIGFTYVAKPFTNIAQAQGVAAHQGRYNLAAVFNWLIQYQDEFKIAPFGGPFPTDRWVGAGPPLVWDIIFRDGLVEAKPPGVVKLPLAHHFGSSDSGPTLQPDFPQGRPEGAGVVMMRSSWDDPAGTLLWFKASSHFLIHSHKDQGSFQVYKKGWLAIDSGQYEETPHLGNYTMRTVAHNSLLIYSPGEILNKDKADPVWVGYANDGGQRWVHPTLTATAVNDIEHYLGGITKFETVSGAYDYVHADITRSYNCLYVTNDGHRPKVSLVTRSLFFLRPDEYIVVFDRVASTKAEYPKRWLLHSVYRPEVDGKETFDGVIPYSQKIPGKPEGVSLRGNIRGGISESRDTSTVTIKGWNFGPSDGRLVCRTLLPAKHITRVVGGSDPRGVRMTKLAKPYKEGGTIVVEDVNGFEIEDLVYLGETKMPYSYGNHGSPHWPVDDVLYQGWGRIQSVDPKAKTITMVRYAYNIPNLPEGAVVMRSDHANSKAFEFMDAEYKQWRMYGEDAANAGPFYMQHGCWRIEVEPIEQKTGDVFLHVMLPCDKDTLAEGQAALKEKVRFTKNDDSINLEIEGKKRTYKLVLKTGSADAHVTINEAGKTILNNELTRAAIKARAK